MNNLNRFGIRYALAGMAAAVLGSASLATAAGPPDFSFDLPAGLACAFDLRIEGWGGNQVNKEFMDKDGNVIRLLSAGTGSALRFTNLATSATLSLKSNGAVSHVTVNPDGSFTQMNTGHTILILFPTDTPPGPSTTLYVGRIVFTIDASSNFTLQQQSGNSVDICAALS